MSHNPCYTDHANFKGFGFCKYNETKTILFLFESLYDNSCSQVSTIGVTADKAVLSMHEFSFGKSKNKTRDNEVEQFCQGLHDWLMKILFTTKKLITLWVQYVIPEFYLQACKKCQTNFAEEQNHKGPNRFKNIMTR